MLLSFFLGMSLSIEIYKYELRKIKMLFLIQGLRFVLMAVLQYCVHL